METELAAGWRPFHLRGSFVVAVAAVVVLAAVAAASSHVDVVVEAVVDAELGDSGDAVAGGDDENFDVDVELRQLKNLSEAVVAVVDDAPLNAGESRDVVDDAVADVVVVVDDDVDGDEDGCDYVAFVSERITVNGNFVADDFGCGAVAAALKLHCRREGVEYHSCSSWC